MIIILLIGVVCMAEPGSAEAGDKVGITHTPLLKSVLPGTANEQVIVWDTQYAPGAVNPRHLHPAAITFRVLSGTGIWQEDGKPPVTLHAGNSLFVPAGTVHAHWNPSTSDPLRFLEFIVAEKDKGRSIPRPDKR
jgi:quercetin dioxygenase-like cupin family protein